VSAAVGPAPWSGLDALLGRGGSAQAVGLGAGQDWAALARRREAWRQALPAGGGRVALFLEDGFEFCAALLGAWSAGRTVVLPADATPATALALSAQGVALLGAFPGAVAPPGAGGTEEAQAGRRLPGLPLQVFTSGSTGEPLAIDKPRRCLDGELRALEQAFGPRFDGAAVLATVSHQHYYGLLFRALIPLVSGRPAWAAQLKLPEEVAAACAAAGPCVLVSSPALLKRLAGSPQGVEALAPARAQLRAVFSSGGPLPWDAVCRCQAALGHAPVEVYGSSETGGVAWRQRQREDQPWASLPGVQVVLDADGGLRLRSAHLPDDAWTGTADLAQAVEGGFRLLGRRDRVAKVEEKRVSLGALERCLQAHPAVAEAKVLLLPGQRDELGAVLRLAGGEALPLGEAKQRLLAELKARLADAFEAVASPRRWRLVHELPVDSLGKTSLAALRALFDPAEAPRWPECLMARRSPDGEAQLDLLLTPGLHWFHGHFPQVAILPGLVQVHWAVAYAAQELGLAGPFRGLQALKFQRPLRPGMRVTLGLRPRPDGRGFEFTYTGEAGRYASGRVLLG
jgi:acyl-coenzyme A synthetase/AMP-(fatty) acid ligase